MTIKIQIVALVLSISALGFFGPNARAQDAHEDLSACPGTAPEPSQSTTWSVAFCNRTGHDLLIEFHDNDCPANDWSRRGDVYQRTLKRGESRTLPLCYANETGKKPAPGTPTLHTPKGVTTTWSVVGDCGDHSKPLNMDARSFYDRGDFKTGIILLQYPSSASHCTSDAAAASTGPAVAASSAAAAAAPSYPTPAPQSAGAAAPAPAYAPQSANTAGPAYATQPPPGTTAPYIPPSAGTAAPAGAAPAQPPAVPRTSGAPQLSAAVNTAGLIQHSVLVYAKGGAGYHCNMNLLVTFSDGATWNDHAKVDITGNDEQQPITTRKYLKTPTDVTITSNKCAPK